MCTLRRFVGPVLSVLCFAGTNLYCVGAMVGANKLKVASRWDRWDLLGLGMLGRSVAAGAGAARESNARVRLPASAAAAAAHEAAIRDVPPKCRRRVAVGADNGSCPETGEQTCVFTGRNLDAGCVWMDWMLDGFDGSWGGNRKELSCPLCLVGIGIGIADGSAACACSKRAATHTLSAHGRQGQESRTAGG